MIVQGRQASASSNVVIKYTLADIQSALLFEALNAYSVVFSGVILKTSIPVLLGHTRTPRLRKVGDVEALVNGSDGSQDGLIDVSC